MGAKAPVAQLTEVSRQPIVPDLHASDYPAGARRLQQNPTDDPAFWVRVTGPTFLVYPPTALAPSLLCGNPSIMRGASHASHRSTAHSRTGLRLL